MKKLAFTLAVAAVGFTYAQNKVTSYTANNGITYNVGDRFNLGEGSDNGQFRHLTIAGIFKTVNNLTKNNNPDDTVNPSFAGKSVTLKKIKNVMINGREETIFIVNKGMVANYELNIEEAIASCEIKDCDNNSRNSNYSQKQEESPAPAPSRIERIIEEKKPEVTEVAQNTSKNYLTDEKMEALLKLKKLKDSEVLSEEEFQKEKNKILN